MQIDKTTLADLSVFSHDEESSLFHYLNFTHTNGGREYLKLFLAKPLDNIEAIEDRQRSIKAFIEIADIWPTNITNGTLMVIEKYYDSQVDIYPSAPNFLNSFLYKLFNAPDFALTRYSIEHCIFLFKGFQKIVGLFNNIQTGTNVSTWLERVRMLLNKEAVQQIVRWEGKEKLSLVQVLDYGNYIRYHFKYEMFELIEIYYQLDTLLSCAIACKKLNFNFPSFTLSDTPYLRSTELFHPQLRIPVSYNVELLPQGNFLFLTGANMAGKSTFIKAVGIAAFFAHLGMGVPAKNMELSLFDGLLSNIQVNDDITKGESYFFNEVQRIKNTVIEISNGKKWLILIDELFKGTNIQDAMKCSTVVIEGLLKIPKALFVLSTHLYEIGDHLKQYPQIQFRYFETSIQDDQLVFSYQLKDGISNDRIGYLILKREGVVDLLEKI